jgi:hypothetical protein
VSRKCLLGAYAEENMRLRRLSILLTLLCWFGGDSTSAVAQDEPGVSPQVSIISPSDGGSYTTPLQLNIVLEATSATNITKIDVYSHEDLIGTVTEAPYEIVWENVPPGLHQLTAIATDDQGGEGVSESVEVLVVPGPCTVCDKYEGSLTEEEGSAFLPIEGSDYVEHAGTLKAWLVGPDATDFDLYLWVWNGSEWEMVERAEAEGSDEFLIHDVQPGYYSWMIVPFAGGGDYTLWVEKPVVESPETPESPENPGEEGTPAE